MKAKDLLDCCEQLEYMARVGRNAATGLPPDADVPQSPRTAPILAVAGWMWAMRPEAKQR